LVALPADASSRRYFRLEGVGLLLMDSPPHSCRLAFVRVARQLHGLGLSAPALLQVDEEAGLALIEDFGHDTYTRLLAAGYPERELYRLAVDALVALHGSAPGAERRGLRRPAIERRVRVVHRLVCAVVDRQGGGAGFARVGHRSSLPMPSPMSRNVARRWYCATFTSTPDAAVREGVAACGLLTSRMRWWALRRTT
jgi:hypothetical protein